MYNPIVWAGFIARFRPEDFEKLDALARSHMPPREQCAFTRSVVDWHPPLIVPPGLESIALEQRADDCWIDPQYEDDGNPDAFRFSVRATRGTYTAERGTEPAGSFHQTNNGLSERTWCAVSGEMEWR